VIERLYFKDSLTFKEVDLAFDNGLIVFTGPSGAGKSVLFETILSLFGLKEARASLCEAVIDDSVNLEEFGIESDEFLSFKYTQSSKLRYYINNQSIAKKSVTNVASTLIKFLSLKDYSDFSNSSLLEALDDFIMTKEKGYSKELDKLKALYHDYMEQTKVLNKLIEDEKQVDELKEFTKFEIDKIDKIAPVEGEYEELTQLKKEFSKKEKILKAITKASPIFELESDVGSVLTLLEVDSSFFDEAMNELNALFEDTTMKFEELDDDNVEQMLDRVEQLATLIKKHGSIEEALNYLEEKKQQLEQYENISIDKSKMQKALDESAKALDVLTTSITKSRQKYASSFQSVMESYIKKLNLNNVTVLVESTELSSTGKDQITLQLQGVGLKEISSGEFNRLRLALIATKNEVGSNQGGVLVLDEIDANLSGVESESVAEVLSELSQKYQIFSISHQPQLTSKANQHFVVTKESGVSTVTQIEGDARTNEIARMISGANITDEALTFAKNLLS
jgi:DNA repair protein RecN (Recombination protein N)